MPEKNPKGTYSKMPSVVMSRQALWEALAWLWSITLTLHSSPQRGVNKTERSGKTGDAGGCYPLSASISTASNWFQYFSEAWEHSWLWLSNPDY